MQCMRAYIWIWHPPRTRPRHGAPPEGEGPARRLQGAGGESGTPTRTAPTARTTSSTWPSRARAASCEARGSEGGRAQRGCGCTRYRGGGVSGLYAHYSRFRGRLSAYMYSCILHVCGWRITVIHLPLPPVRRGRWSICYSLYYLPAPRNREPAPGRPHSREPRTKKRATRRSGNPCFCSRPCPGCGRVVAKQRG